MLPNEHGEAALNFPTLFEIDTRQAAIVLMINRFNGKFAPHRLGAFGPSR
ncbi:hypothetical protein [Methylobacterium sp. WL103]|nr:hypothetical protein [Methylobacterium sp. WL103]